MTTRGDRFGIPGWNGKNEVEEGSRDDGSVRKVHEPLMKPEGVL